MSFEELKKHALKFFPALSADAFLPKSLRRVLFKVVFLPLAVCVLALILFGVLNAVKDKVFFADSPELSVRISNEIFSLHSSVLSHLPLLAGLAFLLFATWLFILAVNSFHVYYAGLDLEGEEKDAVPVSFECAGFLLSADRRDIIGSFLRYRLVVLALRRFELVREAGEFLKSRNSALADFAIEKKQGARIGLGDVAGALCKADSEFSAFLASHEITPADFSGAVSWMEYLSGESRKAERWWSRARLGRLSGIGKDWSYGEANFLRRFAVPISGHQSYSSPGSSVSLREDDITELEKILSRSVGSNALVVGDTDEEAMEVVSSLGKLMARGSAMPAIAHKEMMVLDAVGFMSALKDKSSFETGMRKILGEASSAGNIILVVPDLPSFIASAEKIGSNLKEVIDPFLVSPDVQLVSTSAVGPYHAVIEIDQELINRFEKVSVNETSNDVVYRILEKEVIKTEYKRGVFFTYPAIKAIVESAIRYFPGSSPADKAVDLLLELTPAGGRNGADRVIRKSDVTDLVRLKTGVPAGEVGAEEKKKLVNLEQILSERIVGQKEAIKAVSVAMKRARAGIGNPNKPLGSFLFLGPTGVGKTETTKALASVFFGGEDIMHRIDMSEYNTDDSLEKLIGSFGSGKPGVLSSMLRDRPYGVLLLDEFEKTSRKVMDLFLQVLDEGFFSDMSGKRVSARNLIIIATSNAGSELIWRMVKERGYEGVDKDAIIDTIVKDGIFRPEFLNRFDGVVVFHPLNDEHLSVIAGLMLKKLAKRLAEKGLKLSATPALISALVKRGSDPKFGARPMQRAIQDTVEAIIADKLISGEIGPGALVEFSEGELALIAGENTD